VGEEPAPQRLQIEASNAVLSTGDLNSASFIARMILASYLNSASFIARTILASVID
jgi:hypothetical protein